MAKYRSGRINEEIKKEISYIIQNEIRDPRINSMISVTSVNVTNDLRYAKVFLSIFADSAERDDTFKILKKSSPYIRKLLSTRVNLRYTPEIIMELDNSIEHGMHIDSIIEKIKEKEHDNE